MANSNLLLLYCRCCKWKTNQYHIKETPHVSSDRQCVCLSVDSSANIYVFVSHHSPSFSSNFISYDRTECVHIQTEKEKERERREEVVRHVGSVIHTYPLNTHRYTRFLWFLFQIFGREKITHSNQILCVEFHAN